MDEAPRISIVDDDPSVQKALARLCAAAGYRVDTYASAEAFFETGSADDADCLILDVHLPGRSGLEIQSALRAANQNVPIVFVTAFDDDQVRKQALENGAMEFLRKPLDVKRLLECIHHAVARR